MKLNGLLNIALLSALAYTLGSCDTVAEDDRLIYVKPAEVNRSVLIEDFTGQRCTNCPKATEEIEKLKAEYGDAIIAVGIHSGPFGHRTTMNSARLSLCTETGDEYYTHWGVTAQPAVMINRGQIVYNTEGITTEVNKALEQSTPLSLTLETTYNPDTRKVNVTVSGMSGESVNGKLQVWVIENNIVDQQSMPDGSMNSEYEHQHVFRSSVTADIYGDAFNVLEGETTLTHYETTLDEGWKPEDIAVVAFVSNDADGVLQIVKSDITTNE